ncbi:MAG: cold shock domain-containing protein [Acidobacteriota bacterium]
MTELPLFDGEPSDSVSTPTVLVGRVKWYSLAKGYGFLESDDVSDDIFVHHSQLARNDDVLEPGERIRFELVSGPKGYQASNVRRLDRDDS